MPACGLIWHPKINISHCTTLVTSCLRLRISKSRGSTPETDSIPCHVPGTEGPKWRLEKGAQSQHLPESRGRGMEYSFGCTAARSWILGTYTRIAQGGVTAHLVLAGGRLVGDDTPRVKVLVVHPIHCQPRANRPLAPDRSLCASSRPRGQHRKQLGSIYRQLTVVGPTARAHRCCQRWSNR
eukprot:8041275-Pyramimonas_sp.AAC.1